MSSFWNKLFGKKSVPDKQIEEERNVRIPECVGIQNLSNVLEQLLVKEHYVARSEYAPMLPEYQKIVDYFQVLESSGMLLDFCGKNHMDINMIRRTMDYYNKIHEKVEQANEEYISRTLSTEREYLDNILYSVDPVIKLDEDQRKVILTDDDYCLVIAGAGAGKTTTVAAKVKYLVEKKNIDPKDILVISFTNKAVGELREKINKELHIDCPISTFHSVGNAILHIHNPEKLNIVDGSKLYFLLQDYFRNAILTNQSLVKNLILFFASYFDAPYEGDNLNEFFNKIAKANFNTMRSELDEFKKEIIDIRTRKKVTIQNEVVRSYQEVEIANFLYLNNIDYEYEPVYKYNIAFARKPYTPDFLIRQGERTAYIEHFGISEDGKNNMFTEEELERYKRSVNDKILLHRKHGTKLIYTFSAYKDRKSVTEHLRESLEKAGFELNPKSNEEIMEKIISSEESRYIRKLVNLICRFIGNFKTNGYTVEEFGRMFHSTTNVRSRLFLNICEECFLEYERYLKENDAVDFEDMINESARILREVKEMKQKLHFKYIIVDEYQDISRQRFDLTTALSEVTDAKIIAVGDDWQSIYAFSGSDISLFTKFEEKMGYAKLLKIVRTYRNSQEVIDIAGNFIQKNQEQIEKQLLSPKRIEDPVIIYTYDPTYKMRNEDRRTGLMYATAHAVETALEQIMEYNRMAGKEEHGTILLLGRYAFDGDQLERSGLFEYQSRGSKIKSVKYPELDITFMTVHMSKGLGYDNVIVVNGKNETYGFPSKIEDDPVLSFVIRGDDSIDYAEERRLFYVAMTRTKNRVYFIAPEKNPSEFLLEIKRDYKNVVLKGTWNEEEIKHNIARKICPICGYPMQLRYKSNYGLRLYLCTNEPEVCGFMTNDYRAGKLAIMKCEDCRDGYLIAKANKGNGYFLGCTNYTADRKGCNNTMSSGEYYTLMNYSAETAPEVKKMKAREIASKDVRKQEVQPQKTVVSESRKRQEVQPQKAVDDERRSEMGAKNREGQEAAGQKAATDEKRSQQDVKQKKVQEILGQSEGVAKTSVENINDTKKTASVYYKEFDLYEVVECLLNCLEHISEKYFYGIGVLVDVVRGSSRKQIQQGKLLNVPEYNSYPEISKDDLWAIVMWLIDKHYMLRTKEYYKKLHPTYEGRHFKETLTIKMLQELKEYLEDPGRETMGEDEGKR